MSAPGFARPATRPSNHPLRRPPVVAYPCCAPSGYWAYRWVPTTYPTYIRVPGYVAADGTMVAGGYQPRVVSGGYDRQIWVGY